MTFKMKGFSGFGNSPMKNDGKLSKKKKDSKTGEDITPGGVKKKTKTDSARERYFNKNDTINTGVNMPIPKHLTDGKKKKKKKTKTDSARERYFNK